MKRRCCTPDGPNRRSDSIWDENLDEELARYAKALGHPLRVRIVRILAKQKECICGDVVALLPVAQSTVSQHLKMLKEAGLIHSEEDGPRVRYCVDAGSLRRVKALIGRLQLSCTKNQ